MQEFDAMQQLLFSFLQTKDSWTNNHHAFVFHCRTGKSRTSLAMTVASMLFFHMRVSAVRFLLLYVHTLSEIVGLGGRTLRSDRRTIVIIIVGVIIIM